MSKQRKKGQQKTGTRLRHTPDPSDSANAVVEVWSSDLMTILLQKGDDWVVGRLPVFSARMLRSKVGNDGHEDIDLVTTIERLGQHFPSLEQALSHIREVEEGRELFRSDPDMREQFQGWLKDTLEHSDNVRKDHEHEDR